MKGGNKTQDMKVKPGRLGLEKYIRVKGIWTGEVERLGVRIQLNLSV